MSFITKRDRVFQEYDLFDLPARNEGKLKAYASCTDARAWSHFCSDKSEHLVEIIKRNNNKCAPKYLPTHVIVDTLMVVKNAEIGRLKRRVEEFEQMLQAYDHLDLSNEQKSEIAKCHEAIKAANKDLDDLCLDLDLSGFTEVSDAFETGKSRGDETGKSKGLDSEKSRMGDWSFDKQSTPRSDPISDSRGIQNGSIIYPLCDVSTSVTDPRIDEMRDSIISKDAKLNAMQNTIAVMENDVCEPYCIYAHIYTALEKIFGILCQNSKYKQYLDLLSAGKDTRSIDIKGKILYKMKIMEKFCLALIAPCSQDFSGNPNKECECYRIETADNVQMAFALTSSESKKTPSLDNKRAQLVADIMQNEEMKEILSKDNSLNIEGNQEDDVLIIDSYNIDDENLSRLKDLQANYDELVSCYENLKLERDRMKLRCQRYDELEKELETLQDQLRHYNLLWNEKEHYRKRSEDLDNLKENFLVLSEETSNIETRLRAESEINNIKTSTIEDLRSENIELEKKLNDASIAFEKERNLLQCKLKETECKVMCQEQQIKSLSAQIDRLLEQDNGKFEEDGPSSIALLNEIEDLKDQIKNLKDLILCSENEKEQIQEQFQNKLDLINDLRMEIEDWKSSYEKALNRNNYLENYTESFRNDFSRLENENQALTSDINDKSKAVENLIIVINNKSMEMNLLAEELDRIKSDNVELLNKVNNLNKSYEQEIKDTKHIARQESEELLSKVKSYDEIINYQNSIHEDLQKENEVLQAELNTLRYRNEKLQNDLTDQKNENELLTTQVHRMHEINEHVLENNKHLQNEKMEMKDSLEIVKKNSENLQDRLLNMQDLPYQILNIKESREEILKENNELKRSLIEKTAQVEEVTSKINLSKNHSKTLLHDNENLKKELSKLFYDNQTLENAQNDLKQEILSKNENINQLLKQIETMKQECEDVCERNFNLESQLSDLQKAYDDMLERKNILQKDFENQTAELSIICNTLDNKIEENQELDSKIQSLRDQKFAAYDNIVTLEKEKSSTKANLDALRKDSVQLLEQLKNYKYLEIEFNDLKQVHETMEHEKELLQKEFEIQLASFNSIQQENNELHNQINKLMTCNDELEKSLITTRSLLSDGKDSTVEPYSHIKEEIENFKKEKLRSNLKIRELYDKLDESENQIANLSEDLLARNDKIAMMENYVNELEDEIKRLHTILAEIVDTGEQIKENSAQKLETSLKNLDAHHSKAAHNIKMELAKLRNENTNLELKVSHSREKSEESLMQKQESLSQLMHLQNEREIIVTEIKQLELQAVAQSTLSPDNCDLENIISSIDRVRKCLEAKMSKSSTLEQTLLRVQTSSQLLVSKADEAKKIVEKEKHKINSEKEEALRDKANMENQMAYLKQTLEDQINRDKLLINNLQSELLNQNLIIDKITQSKQSYISKLEIEMSKLKDMYQKSIDVNCELEDQVKTLSDKEKYHLDLISKTNIILREKSSEVSDLQHILSEIKSKEFKDVSIQVKSSDNNKSVLIQTDIELQDIIFDNFFENQSVKKKKSDEKDKMLDVDISKRRVMNVKKHDTPQKLTNKNEVQILAATTEVVFDSNNQNNVNEKIKNLTTGPLEQHSISSIDEKPATDRGDELLESLNENSFIMETFTSKEKNSNINNEKSPNLIDIYQKQSLYTNSSKGTEEKDSKLSKYGQKSPTKSSAITQIVKNEAFNTDNSSPFIDSSESLEEKGVFVINNDSENMQDKSANEELIEPKHNKQLWSLNNQSEIIVESVTLEMTEAKVKNLEKNIKRNTPKDKVATKSNKNKKSIDITLPRVETDSMSVITSDTEKKSFDLQSFATYIESKDDFNSEIQIIEKDMPNESPIKKKYYVSNTNGPPHQYSKSRQSFTSNYETDSSADLQKASENVKKDHRREIINVTKEKLGHNSSNKDIEYESRALVPSDVNNVRVTAADDRVTYESSQKVPQKQSDFGLEYILTSVQDIPPENIIVPSGGTKHKHKTLDIMKVKTYANKEVMVKLDANEEYENKIQVLTKALETIENDHKKKLEAIKSQYDNNIKNILNEHNQGVRSIQSLHEETLQDIIKIHENEVENLRTMSIDALRKAEKLEKENNGLRSIIQDSEPGLDQDSVNISTSERKRHRHLSQDSKKLTKTNVEAFNVRPKSRSHGPCTCSLDINISDTIRNIFEQVDVEQRKMAEHAYLKYIANKIITASVENLDAQELSFLHYKVCRTWKSKTSVEEALQKRIDCLENELLNKQRNAQNHIAELDRKVAEERRRLQEVREAVCSSSPPRSRDTSPLRAVHYPPPPAPPAPPPTTVEKDDGCGCKPGRIYRGPDIVHLGERRSAGDLLPILVNSGLRQKRTKTESNRATLVKLDVDERREKRLVNDDPPTRLRRSHDRQARPVKK